MAVVRKYDATLPKVQVPQDLRDRLDRVADDPRVQCSLATVIRDCIEGALPSIELQLGFVELEDLTEDDEVEVSPRICVCDHIEDDHDEQDGCGACALEFTRSCKQFRLRGTKEDRSAGCYGGPPKPE